MHLLLAVHQFFPRFRAGTETLTLRIAQELRRRGHRVTVFTGEDTPASAPALRYDNVDGLSVVRLNVPPVSSLPAGGLAQSYRRPELAPLFDELLRTVRPDLVHHLHLRRLTLSFSEAVIRRGVPQVATLTDFWFPCPTGQLQFPDLRPCDGPDLLAANCLQHLATKHHRAAAAVPAPLWWGLMALAALPGAGRLPPLRPLRDLAGRRAAMCRAYASFDRVLVPSAEMEGILLRNGFPMARTRRCAYGIDTAGIEAFPLRRPWPGPACRPLRIAFIGSFTEAKGAMVLIRALRRLPQDLPVEVALYGNPADDPSYGATIIAAAAGLPAARMAGVFSSDQIFGVLAGHDLLVLPSLWRENSPLILLQAMAVGLPVFASRVSGITSSLREGLDGRLFTPGSEIELAGLIAEACANPNGLAALGNRSTPVRRNEDLVDDLEQCYAELLGVACGRDPLPPRR